MSPYPEYSRILESLRRMWPAARTFSGTAYRACDPLYANTRDLLTGEGGRKHGGRWNPPAGFATVYLAQSVEGAIAETLGVQSHYRFAPAARLPLTLVALDVSLTRVLDYTNARIRSVAGFTLKAILSDVWRDANANGRESLTQALGRAAFELGWEAIAVPSAAKRSFRNLNVFPVNLGRGSHMKILRSDRLPLPPTGH